MSSGHRNRTRRRIDEWEFRTEWVSEAKAGDRHHAVYLVRIDRAASNPFSPELSERRQVKFIAVMDKARSSAMLQKVSGDPIEAPSYAELYQKVQAEFESFTTLDWRKVILIGVEAPANYRCEETSAALSFNYAVVERAGKMYRRCSGFLTRDRGQIVEGDKIVEMEWNPELEKALEVIQLNIEGLTEKLREIIENPQLLLRIKPNLQLK